MRLDDFAKAIAETEAVAEPDTPVTVTENNLLYHAVIEYRPTALGPTVVIRRGERVVW